MTVGAALARSVSTGNGSTTEFPFNAPVAAASEIKVYTVVIATGVQTLQTQGGGGTYDYSVAINASTNYATITVNNALPDTHKIVIMRNVPLTQETDYVEGDAFGAETHEAALDKLTMIAAQISEVADRSIKVQETSATSNITCAELVADKVLKVNSDGDGIEMGPTTANLDTLAGITSDITTVAGISSNVTSVAGNATNINAVAADATDIGAVAGKATEIGRLGTADAVADLAILGTTDIVSDMNTLGTSGNVTNMDTLAGIASNITTVAGISSNVTTVAGISSNVTTVAGVASNVTTVAGVSSNVTTVAGIASNVTTVANNVSGINDFAARYRVGSSDPGSDNDAGDLNFNTSSNQLKYWTGSAWAVVANTDTNVAISANDTTPDLLLNKLTAGSNISLTETNDGGDETITIAASGETKPTITGISPTTITNTASNIVITGTNYVITPNVEFIASTGVITLPNSIVRDSATQLTVNVTLPTDGTYFIRVENPDGLAVRSGSALLTVSDAPTWSTSAGSLGSVAAGASVSFDVDASSDSTVAFSETTSVLTSNSNTPASTMNLTLNSSTGAITGTAPAATAETTYNFTLRATDAESQTADRAFSITVTVGINNSGGFN
tara:strand:+ start:20033 stop:21889 length:1857 start_codon:yes stop_codon:yes gene_type:complete